MTRKISPAHPGRILKEEFMEPMGVTNYRLAELSGLSRMAIGRIVKEKASITADIALRLEAIFGLDAQTWLNMQSGYDLLMAKVANGKQIARTIKRLESVEAHASAF
jgi:addiction module HigA family antidote